MTLECKFGSNNVTGMETGLFGATPSRRMACLRYFCSSWTAFNNAFPTSGAFGGELADALTYGRTVQVSLRTADPSTSAGQDSWGPTSDSLHTGAPVISTGDRDTEIRRVADGLANYLTQGGYLIFTMDHEPYLWSNDQLEDQGQAYGNMDDVAYRKGHGTYYVAAFVRFITRIKARWASQGVSAAAQARAQFAPVFTIGQARRGFLDEFWGSGIASGGLTIDFGTETQSGCAWSMVELSNVNTGGTNGSAAVVQVVTANTADANATSLSITMAAFGQAGNTAYGAFAVNGGGTDAMVAGSGFTVVHDIATTTPITRLGTEYKLGQDTTIDMSLRDSSLLKWGGIGIEVDRSGVTAVSTEEVYGYDDTNATQYITGSVSRGVNTLLLLAVVSSRTTDDPSAPTTVTGNGVTWVQVATTLLQTTGTVRRRLSVYRAMGGAAVSLGDYTDVIAFDVYSQTPLGGFTNNLDPACQSFRQAWLGLNYNGDDPNAWVQTTAQKHWQIWEWGCLQEASNGYGDDGAGDDLAAVKTAQAAWIADAKTYIKGQAADFTYQCTAISYFWANPSGSNNDWKFAVSPRDEAGDAFKAMGEEPFFGGITAPTLSAVAISAIVPALVVSTVPGEVVAGVPVGRSVVIPAMPVDVVAAPAPTLVPVAVAVTVPAATAEVTAAEAPTKTHHGRGHTDDVWYGLEFGP